MNVELLQLKPNPFRDFVVDPIDKDNVAGLTQSIQEDGFWGGVVGRCINGYVEIVAGHHRVAAAVSAGLRTADIYIGDFDDATMVRVYARENATQRGNTSAAVLGSVAAAIRVILKDLLVSGRLSGIPDKPDEDIEKLLGNLTSEKGIGQRVVTEFLKGVKGINKNTVEQSLALLKSTGDYARIVTEVQVEIHAEQERAEAERQRQEEQARERERAAEQARVAAEKRAAAAREEREKREAAAAVAKAEKEKREAEVARRATEERAAAERVKAEETQGKAQGAVNAANQKAKTLDIEAVQVFANAHQQQVFAELVQSPGVAPYLPVSGQKAFAEHLTEVYDSQKRKGPMTGAWLREQIIAEVMNITRTQRKLNKEEQARKEAENWSLKWEQRMGDFVSVCTRFFTAGEELNKLSKGRPKGAVIPMPHRLKDAIKLVKQTAEKLDKQL